MTRHHKDHVVRWWHTAVRLLATVFVLLYTVSLLGVIPKLERIPLPLLYISLFLLTSDMLASGVKSLSLDRKSGLKVDFYDDEEEEEIV